MTGSPLRRSLGTVDATAIGIASMLGAGVFVVWGRVVTASGQLLLVSLGLAALVAVCNATSSAQLAAEYPAAGGTYVFGRERLGAWPGFLAGWSFLVGKTASCAAMAMAFAAYTVPGVWQRPTAIATVWVLVGVNCLGVTRTALLAKILAATALAGIVVALGVGWSSGPTASFGWLGDTAGTPYGVLQAAGLLFFAFAGYARIATMGEEVRDPARSIPRAILLALGSVLVLYAVVGVSLLLLLGPAGLATAPAPLALLVADRPAAGVVVAVAAAAATGGALLALMTGVGRTWLAMAREGDLPRWFAATHPRTQVPHRAELALGVVLTAILLVADLRGAIGFSSFAVLLYYLVANVAAFTQTRRSYPRALQVIGAALCVVMVATLPWPSVVGGLVLVVAGGLWRAVGARRLG